MSIHVGYSRDSLTLQAFICRRTSLTDSGGTLQIAVLARDGTVIYNAVYAFGHNDPLPISMFVKLSTDTHDLRLSPDHFVQTAAGRPNPRLNSPYGR